MSATAPGPAVDLIDHAARIIVAEKRKPHTAPYHWAGALWQAGMLVAPGTAEPVERSDLPVGQQSKSCFEEIDRLTREVATMTEVAQGNKRHVKYLTEENEALRAEVARVRAQVAEDIARKIRAELVCCDVYERMAPKRAEIQAQQPGWSRASAELDDAIYEHEPCYWGEAAARTAAVPAESVVAAPVRARAPVAADQCPERLPDGSICRQDNTDSWGPCADHAATRVDRLPKE